MKDEKFSDPRLVHALALYLRRIAGKEEEDPALDLTNTPERFLHGMADMLSGYSKESLTDVERSFKVFPSHGDKGMVVERFDYSSICSHHLLPFYGKMWVGYVPNKLLWGMSKPARVIQHHSRRLQLQERLNEQVADYLFARAKPKLVIVASNARHLCMCARGVREVNAKATVVCMKPWIARSRERREALEEFYSIIQLQEVPL